uniref:Shisa like 2A n=1 Tax=Neogobius melanostomus TaxID=47308 RepID=A0A8C6U7J3_9GOBI
MEAECSSYINEYGRLVGAFSCPKLENPSAAYCCGFNDMKYCCDDPHSFYPYEYGYMWWLSFGALAGLSVAAVVLLAFLIIVCVLCYLFIATKPSRLDNGLKDQAIAVGHMSPPQNWGVMIISRPIRITFFRGVSQLISLRSKWKVPRISKTCSINS